MTKSFRECSFWQFVASAECSFWQFVASSFFEIVADRREYELAFPRFGRMPAACQGCTQVGDRVCCKKQNECSASNSRPTFPPKSATLCFPAGAVRRRGDKLSSAWRSTTPGHPAFCVQYNNKEASAQQWIFNSLAE